jgi:hypothetical protein
MHAELADKPVIPAFDDGVCLSGQTIFEKV